MRAYKLAATLGLSLIGCAPAATSSGPSPAAPAVRNIILLVADGAGAGLWNAARYADEDLSVERMSVLGLVDTRSASHRVTDSAAGATAYSTGQRVSNRTIAVSQECPVPRGNDTVVVAWAAGCEPLQTWFEVARDKGKATGIVTTTAVVDATPASFVAHAPSRYWADSIAEQTAAFGLDVLMGGGRQHFLAEGRNDRRDLLGELCARSLCIDTATELHGYQADERPLIGLFVDSDLDDHEPRPVTLPAMVAAALSRLERHPDGFVALFESEATDNSTHANASLERVTADILEFDRAVGVALDFAASNPGTLVIVTGDHETGGLSLREAGRNVAISYTTEGHTAGLVPLFASGPGAERFGGLIDNTEVGRVLFELVQGW